MPNYKKLSNLQLNILDVLWENGSLSIQDLRKHLEPQKKLATSSIATILARLEKRGLVKYSKSGRKFIYSANISKDDVTNTSLSSLINNFFNGSKTALVNHLLAEDLNLAELEHIQNLIQERAANNV